MAHADGTPILDKGSYEAGKGAGRREVAKWLKEHCVLSVETEGVVTYVFHATSGDWLKYRSDK